MDVLALLKCFAAAICCTTETVEVMTCMKCPCIDLSGVHDVTVIVRSASTTRLVGAVSDITVIDGRINGDPEELCTPGVAEVLGERRTVKCKSKIQPAVTTQQTVTTQEAITTQPATTTQPPTQPTVTTQSATQPTTTTQPAVTTQPAATTQPTSTTQSGVTNQSATTQPTITTKPAVTILPAVTTHPTTTTQATVTTQPPATVTGDDLTINLTIIIILVPLVVFAIIIVAIIIIACRRNSCRCVATFESGDAPRVAANDGGDDDGNGDGGRGQSDVVLPRSPDQTCTPAPQNPSARSAPSRLRRSLRIQERNDQ